MTLEIGSKLKSRLPGLQVVVGYVDGVRVESSSAELQKFKEEVLGEVKRKYSLESLKDVAIFRAYRDFFWKIGIDPTKIRPAAEALGEYWLANRFRLSTTLWILTIWLPSGLRLRSRHSIDSISIESLVTS
jgi:hypothetical protein